MLIKNRMQRFANLMHPYIFFSTIEYNEFDGISMSKRGWDMGNNSKWN